MSAPSHEEAVVGPFRFMFVGRVAIALGSCHISCMSEQASDREPPAGWIVEVEIGGQRERWDAAIADPSEAVQAVREASGALPADSVEAKHPLSPGEILQLKMSDGQVRVQTGTRP